MEKVRSACRVFLGAIITVCGALLLLYWDPTTNLQGIFEKLGCIFEPFICLIPYAIYYFKINALCFTLAGILTILNHRNAVVLQAVGALMFGLTFDNPFIDADLNKRLLRCIFLLCHGIVVAALLALKNAEKPEEEVKLRHE